MSLPIVDLGVGHYISETPSSRFPVYTRGNAGEVWPEVPYPLSLALSRAANDDAFRTVALRSGIVTADDLTDGPVCFGGCFGGYMYLNVSFSRLLAIRTPGTTIAESDAMYLGTEHAAPPHVAHPDDRNLRASLRALRYFWRMLKVTEVGHLGDDRQVVQAWQRRLPDLLGAADAEILRVIRDLTEPIMRLFTNHLEVSGRAGGAVQALAGFCESQVGDRSRVLTLLGGLGDVDSAAPSWVLWELGRKVAADPALAAHFDAGLDGLAGRLATDPAAGGFNDAFAAFVDRFGSRGPNEWETASETWGTDPGLALALIDRMRGADERHAPSVRADELARARELAVVATRAEVRWPLRWLYDRMVRAATMYSQARERSKTTVVDLIHVARLLQRELAQRTASRVEGGHMLDMWLLLDTELDAYLVDPGSLADTIAERRSARQELSRRVPPFVFDGRQPPPTEWPLREAVPAVAATQVGEVLVGTAGCPGVAEGRARVVTDPSRPGDLGPGDVLIAPLTDPSWTPLFVPVEAVVVDVGGQMSHAVIVSRELGLPCVVAVTDATRSIPDGTRVRVDGTAGTVTVLGA